MVVAGKTINVRGGPGTDYAVVGSLDNGDNVRIVAKNNAGDWWQIRLPNEVLGWVYNAIVSITGDTAGVPIAANIPAPPATSTPAAPPTPTKPPKPDVDFVVTGVRLWGPQENGGYFDGPSLHCGEKRQLRVKVVDANGNGVNGIWAIQAVAGNPGAILEKRRTELKDYWLMNPENGHATFDMYKHGGYTIYISEDGVNPASTDFTQQLDSAFTDEAQCADGGGGNTLFHNSFSVIFRKNW
jgi:hypothetical protein